jgi:branched-chain amino acid transport system substrate-binding protein
MNRRLSILVALGLAAAATFPVAAQQGVTDTEIVVGDILPLTGPPALLGVAHNLGVKVAVAEINAAGGINGRKLRLISEDDGYVPTRTIQGVRKLVSSDKVFSLTSLSGTAQGRAALPFIKQSGIPTMATISLFDELHKPAIKNVFAIGNDFARVTDTLVSKIAAKYPGKKWALISQDDEYGEQVRLGFERAQKEKQFQTVSSQIYKKGQADFSSEILKVKQSGAEVLMAGGVLAENVSMAKELERTGQKIPMAVTFVSRVPATVKMMGLSGENVYTLDYVFLEDSPKGKAFFDKVRQYLSAEEQGKVNRYTQTGYAGARVMFEAMRRCGKTLTWDCTNAELAKLRDFDTGVMAPISFTTTEHLSSPTLFLMKSDVAAVGYKTLE